MRLGAIAALALLLRGAFFVGLVSGDPQDDGIYYGNALGVYNNGSQYLSAYRNPPADFLANPIDQFNVRPMITYPIAGLFAVLGPGELAASSWSLIASLLSVLVVYRLGAVLHSRSVGLVAALLCAFYPLEVINGTRILSDVHIGFFSSLALLLLFEAAQRDRPWLCVLSGMAVGGAYLANGRGLVLLIVALLSSCAMTLARRLPVRGPLFVAAGFLIVFGLEAVVYYATTGEPLLSYHIQAGASRFKYLHEPTFGFYWGPVRVEYTNGRPFELIRAVFLLDRGPTNQFGVFFYLFVAAVLFSVAKRQNLVLVSIALGLFVYFEFGPVQLSIDWLKREVHYMMVFKQARFIMMLTAPLLIMAASFLVAIGRRSKVAAALLTSSLFVMSLAAASETQRYYRSGLSDLRAAVSDVRSMPERTFYGDLWAVLHLKIFSRHQVTNLAVLDRTTAVDQVRNGCVMLGGSRGVELLSGYVESTLPDFARAVLDSGRPPDGWVLIREIKGERNPQRRADFRIYCVP